MAASSSGRPAITLATRSEADCVPARMLRLVEARPAGEVVKAEADAEKRARDASSARESFMVFDMVVFDCSKYESGKKRAGSVSKPSW